MVVCPIINTVVVSKMLVDGGAGLNLISATLMEKLQITEEQLKPTGPFQGVNPGTTQPRGKIVLPVTFGTRENYRTEKLRPMWQIFPCPTTASSAAPRWPSSWPSPTMRIIRSRCRQHGTRRAPR